MQQNDNVKTENLFCKLIKVKKLHHRINISILTLSSQILHLSLVHSGLASFASFLSIMSDHLCNSIPLVKHIEVEDLRGESVSQTIHTNIFRLMDGWMIDAIFIQKEI